MASAISQPVSQAFGCRIHSGNHASRIRGDYPVAYRLQRDGQIFFTKTQFVFSAFALSHIIGQHKLRMTITKLQCMGGYLNQDDAAVFTAVIP